MVKSGRMADAIWDAKRGYSVEEAARHSTTFACSFSAKASSSLLPTLTLIEVSIHAAILNTNVFS